MGVGMVLWKHETGVISYPLLTRLVEVDLDTETMTLSIRPCAAQPTLELQVYAAQDNPGLPEIENCAKTFWADFGPDFSPFDKTTFESILTAAVTHIDPNAVYWPNEIGKADRDLPKPDINPRVTDTWVLFARPRGKGVFIQDLKRFVALVNDKFEDIVPGALASILRDPASENVEFNLPSFRGLSMVQGSSSSNRSANPSDLYFPLPFNDEQVQIVQLLEVHDGVAVQGPPGTGKTHTIANIACHYLALGKRVLITSMKEPALNEVKDKLPHDLQSLAISMLSSEKEGLKQFEYAISRISTEIQGLNENSYRRDIAHLDSALDSTHAKLAQIDGDIRRWGLINLSAIKLDDDIISPADAAQLVVKDSDAAEWIPDRLGIETIFHPRMQNSDMAALRQARIHVGKDIAYLGKNLPKLSQFPTSRDLLRVHSDLVRYTALKNEIDSGHVLHLSNSEHAIYEEAERVTGELSNLGLLRTQISNIQDGWLKVLRTRIERRDNDPVIQLFEKLREDISLEFSRKTDFMSRPISVPEDVEGNSELVEAIRNRADGKRAFGLLTGITRGKDKKRLDAITVMGSLVAQDSDWAHVHGYLTHRQYLRECLIRWNAIAGELSLDTLQIHPDIAGRCIQVFDAYQTLLDIHALESKLMPAISLLFPEWKGAMKFRTDDSERLAVESTILHHLNHHRLSETWAVRQQCQSALSGCNGSISEQIRQFFEKEFGVASFDEGEIQNRWSQFTEELDRTHALSPHLKLIIEVTDLIEQSGAPELAAKLRVLQEELQSAIPDNWADGWRIRRLKTYLEAIDAREALPKLSQERNALEARLAALYQEIVIKRTWLKIKTKTTPEIGSALAAYAAAIKLIGKGTGKRAPRYQQDARTAAERANQAIPCWIMPHHRICESMPPQFGYFDLVIIDEASQSDLTALPALLRAKKILVVGDEKQVSPEGVGLEEEKVRQLMQRFLANQVDIFRAQMTPERSIYDLFKVVFQHATVTLKEHFRCVPAIIEYSKREFYHHDIRPLRLPKYSERLDPPLMDIYVEDGFRRHDTNTPEAEYILREIQRIVADPAMAHRTVGVVSLTGDTQALHVWSLIEKNLSFDLIERHKITCGDARTFQGKERDIIFLTMMVSPGDCHASSGKGYDQRFNVAASRARDRMYLVRSVNLEDLSPSDKLRRSLITHFTNPFGSDPKEIKDLRELCESGFEQDVYDVLTERGYRVTPQVPVDRYRIDMVVEGENDRRLAIECDGDQFHGPDKWDDDMRRQRVLERAGWQFWRCFASTFAMNRGSVIADLLALLSDRGIEPIGNAGARPQSIHCGSEIYSFTKSSGDVADEISTELEEPALGTL
jgi:very-short-patch-repair endonuclease